MHASITASVFAFVTLQIESDAAVVSSPSAAPALNVAPSLLLVIHVSGKDVIVIACKFFGNR